MAPDDTMDKKEYPNEGEFYKDGFGERIENETISGDDQTELTGEKMDSDDDMATTSEADEKGFRESLRDEPTSDPQLIKDSDIEDEGRI